MIVARTTNAFVDAKCSLENDRNRVARIEKALGRTRRTMSCEKASRRFKNLITKAKRLGLTTEEVVELPATKRLLPARLTSTSTAWTTLAMIVLVVGGGIVLAFLCAPCVARSRT